MSMYVPLKKPNLPDSDVSHVVISGGYPQFYKALNQIGIKTLLTEHCKDVLLPISYHADMLFSHLSEYDYLVEKNQIGLISELTELGFNNRDTVTLSEKYPADVVLNSCILNDKLICGHHNVHHLLKRNKQVVFSKQGYAKCSVCVVDDNSVITDDESIYDACLGDEIDVLLVGKGSVRLPGYEYGFIGGCSGKISKNIVAFCGDIRTHSDYAKIKSFMVARGVEALCLTDGELTDIGSILPITQYID